MRKKNRDLIWLISVSVFISIGVILAYIDEFGFTRIYAQISRLVIMMFIGYYLCLEKQWARWTFVTLYYIAAIFGICTTVIIKEFYPPMIALTTFHAFAGTYLAFIRKWAK